MKTHMLFSSLAAAAALLLGSCSTDVNRSVQSDNIPITFTIATPGSEGVIYPNQRATRATHDQAEWAINQMSLLVYDATEATAPKFLRKHDLTTDIDLYDNGNDTYSFSVEAPISDMNAKRKFAFVVNDDASVAAVETGSTEETLHNSTIASIALNDNDTADKLASEENGIAMSGTATSDGVNEVITVTPGLKCQVKLKRIVARIDIQNNTPNMTLESAVLVKAAKQGYIFPQTAIAAPTEERLTLGSNAKVDITAQHPVLGPDDVFAPKTFNKVFYTYERPNTTEDYAAVRIAYRVNDSKGTIEVPFIRTELGGQQTPVDITRNNLYTIVLGNGEPVETNPLTFSIKVEEWNVVEMPEEIGPGVDQLDPSSQAALNAKLKVNMFTTHHVKTLDKNSKKVTFYTSVIPTQEEYVKESYFSYRWLAGQDASNNTPNGVNNTIDLRHATFTDDSGAEYRLPTLGELMLLVPYRLEDQDKPHVDETGKWIAAPDGSGNGNVIPLWNDNASSNSDKACMIMYDQYGASYMFTETAYLEDSSDCTANTSGSSVTGTSCLRLGKLTETVTDTDGKQYNIHPVYAIRFKGSSEYAAYRYESLAIADDPTQRYISLKIKALPSFSTLTIDDITDNEQFWADSYIEFSLPVMGYYTTSVNQLKDFGLTDRYLASTCQANLEDCHIVYLYSWSNIDSSFQGLSNLGTLRLVKVDK